MQITAPSATVAAIWDRLAASQAPLGRAACCRADLPSIFAEAAATGWTGTLETETVLLAAGLGVPAGNVCETLALFGVTPQWLYWRPGARVTGLLGIQRVAAIDFAHLMLQVQRFGFPIDPAPLCEALLPGLRVKRLLTSAEMAVYWHARECHRCEPMEVAAGQGLTWGRPAEVVLTADGYRAELFHDAGAEPVAMKVTAPRWRRRRSALPFAA